MSPSMSVPDIVKVKMLFSSVVLLPIELSTGASLIGFMDKDIVAGLELSCPSLALKVNESDPL